jgi:predicted O-methyltransferase YrrM
VPFSVERSPEIESRRQFAELCNTHGLIEAAEVGTDRGTWAHEFLTKWKGFTLLCIDPYEPYAEMQRDRLPDLLMATARLAQFGDRVRFLRCKSPDVLDTYPADARIDFVYIDGAHDRDSVARDLAAWWDRIHAGGILAGHDFDEWHPGVMQAVTEFAKPRDLNVFITYEGDSPPSWYIHKPL